MPVQIYFITLSFHLQLEHGMILLPRLKPLHQLPRSNIGWIEIFINRLNILIVVLNSVRFYMLGYEWTVALSAHISIGKTLFQVLRVHVAVSKVHTTSFSNARTTYYSETDAFRTTSTNSTLMICFTVYPVPLRQRMKYCSLKSKTLYFILKVRLSNL